MIEKSWNFHSVKFEIPFFVQTLNSITTWKISILAKNAIIAASMKILLLTIAEKSARESISTLELFWTSSKKWPLRKRWRHVRNQKASAICVDLIFGLRHHGVGTSCPWWGISPWKKKGVLFKKGCSFWFQMFMGRGSWRAS